MRRLIAAVFVLLAPGWAVAEVADSGANGFTVKITLAIQAPPADLYRKLIRIGEWWSPAHTFSGDAHNLSIEEKPMGCFCEKLPNQGGVRHMEVVHIAPPKGLVMTGALGPLQSQAATGNMSIEIAADGGGSKISVVYAVVGYSAGGMNSWAAPVDSVLQEQFTRLKNYAEHGSPAPPAK